MPDEIAAKGKKYYDEHLRQVLEPEHTGEFVLIDYETGRYFLGRTGGEAMDKGNKILPDKILFLARIGYEAAYKFGGFHRIRKQ